MRCPDIFELLADRVPDEVRVWPRTDVNWLLSAIIGGTSLEYIFERWFFAVWTGMLDEATEPRRKSAPAGHRPSTSARSVGLYALCMKTGVRTAIGLVVAGAMFFGGCQYGRNRPGDAKSPPVTTPGAGSTTPPVIDATCATTQLRVLNIGKPTVWAALGDSYSAGVGGVESNQLWGRTYSTPTRSWPRSG